MIEPPFLRHDDSMTQQETRSKHTVKVDPQRLAVYEAIMHCLDKSHRAQLDDLLSTTYCKANFTTEQKQFTTHLAYSLCRYWYALDAILTPWLKKPLQTLDTRTYVLLKLGLVQLSEACKTPDYAAIETTLNLAEHLRFDRPRRGFLNAILQQAVREKSTWSLASEHLLPQWLLLDKPINRKQLEQALSNPTKGVGIRINSLCITPEAYQASLSKMGIRFECQNNDNNWLFLTEIGNIDALPGYPEGYFIPQNQSAYQACLTLDPQPQEHILEIGSAPGGKTTHLAALMNNTGQIIALDIQPKRLTLLQQNIHRLKVNNTHAVCLDITTQALEQPYSYFDRILIDAPCSASGIICRHPDVLLQLTPQDSTRHNETQLTLLIKAWPYLKTTGTLVYSTCSIFDSENQQLIQSFLSLTPNAKVVFEKQIWPEGVYDGFYIAKLVKTASIN